MKDFRELIRKLTEPGTPQAALFFGVLGLIIALLFLLIGFWKTLLVVVCGLIGIFLGAVKDKGEFIRRIANRFHQGKR